GRLEVSDARGNEARQLLFILIDRMTSEVKAQCVLFSRQALPVRPLAYTKIAFIGVSFVIFRRGSESITEKVHHPAILVLMVLRRRFQRIIQGCAQYCTIGPQTIQGA